MTCLNTKVVYILVLILIASMAANQLPRAHSQSYTDTEKAFAFLTDVIQLDLTQYQPVIKHIGPLNWSLLGPNPMPPTTQIDIQLSPDIPHTSGVGTSAGFHSIVWLSNGTPYYLSMSGANMTMHYTQAQPSTALGISKEMLQRYIIYLARYCSVDGNYLQPMVKMLNTIAKPVSTVQVSGNVQMKIDYEEKVLLTNATKTYINWVYVSNGVTADRKHISLDFPNGTISHFIDNWNLYNVGTLDMISKQEAISMAYSAAEGFTLKLVNSSGQTYEIKPKLSNSAIASVFMFPRNSTQLYPFWKIQILFSGSYGNVVGIEVGIWGDTKEIDSCHEYGYLGSPPPDGSPETTPSVPEWSWLALLPLSLIVLAVALVLKRARARTT
jgi:hypothetical protein